MKIIHDNEHCEIVYNNLREVINKRDFERVGQLRKCSAVVYETNLFYYLMSYNTVVAVICKRTNNCIDFLRLVYGYTATSAQHITKFCKDYNATTIYRYK